VSGTATVCWYECAYNSSTKIIFVDTPGFDDSFKSDAEVLREIADWLSRAYEKKIMLTGIIYLHRITDVRVGGSALKNLSMFRKLCGEDAFGSVVLATTWWDKVDLAFGEEREKELISEKAFWVGMVNRGSKVFRQNNGAVSARLIVDYLVNRKQKMKLQIQEELVTEKKTLDQTGAGLEVGAQLDARMKQFEVQLKQIREDIVGAVNAKDVALQKELDDIKNDKEKEMKKAEEERLRIHLGNEELHRQRESELAEQRIKLIEEKQEYEAKMVEKEHELALLEEKNERKLQKLQLENDLQKERAKRLKLEKAIIRQRSTCNVM
jgi:hypothetical protein